MSEAEMALEEQRFQRFRTLYAKAAISRHPDYRPFTRMVESDHPEREHSHSQVLRVRVQDSMFQVYVRLPSPELDSFKHQFLRLPHSNASVQNYLRPILDHLLNALRVITGIEGDPSDFLFILCRAYEDVVQNIWE
jgi:hypothetical protein